MWPRPAAASFRRRWRLADAGLSRSSSPMGRCSFGMITVIPSRFSPFHAAVRALISRRFDTVAHIGQAAEPHRLFEVQAANLLASCKRFFLRPEYDRLRWVTYLPDSSLMV